MSADGKTLTGDITYEDPKAYTSKWSAVVKYPLGRAALAEFACAESPLDPATGEMNPIPVATKPDF